MFRYLRSITGRMTAILMACATALTIVQLASTRWSIATVSDEIYSAAYANVNYLCGHIEDNVQAITMQLDYLLKYDEVMGFYVYSGTARNSEYFTRLGSILDLLALTRSGNVFIQELRLYYPSEGLCAVSGISANKNAVRKIEWLAEGDTEALKDRLERYKAQNSTFAEIDGEYVVAMSARTSGGNKLPACYVEAVLNRDELLSQLTSFSEYRDKAAVQFNHATGALLVSSGFRIAEGEKDELRAMFAPADTGVRSAYLQIGGEEYTVVSRYTRSLNCTFAQLVPTADLESIPRRVYRIMLVAAGLVLLSVAGIAILFRRQVHLPIRDLLKAFEATGRGDFATRVSGRYADEFKELAQRFNQMNEHITSLVVANYDQTIRLQRAEFKQLQAQITPHFLYNSFFLLRHLVQFGDEDTCLECLNHLGRYFQYISDGTRDYVPLAGEYEHATHYLQIQLMRFEQMLRLDIEPLPEKYAGMVVLKLTLQPILENVLTHSVWRQNRMRVIRLWFRETRIGERAYLEITIEDNGEGVDDSAVAKVRERLSGDEPNQETSGLINIHRRLRAYYADEACGIEVGRSALGGFMARMRLGTEAALRRERQPSSFS